MSNLVNLAKRIKDVLENQEFELDMLDYCGVSYPLDLIGKPIHECGTTFCIAGALAHLDGYPEKYRRGITFEYMDYSEGLIGNSYFNHVWEYLFSTAWSDDKNLAIQRMEYVIEHGEIMPVGMWKDYGWGE